jgi:hypothetical protein
MIWIGKVMTRNVLYRNLYGWRVSRELFEVFMMCQLRIHFLNVLASNVLRDNGRVVFLFGTSPQGILSIREWSNQQSTQSI